MEEMNVYQKNGYRNRMHYLKSIADDYCLNLSTVLMAANMLGPNEDFDGLISFLEDIEEEGDFE